MALVPDVDKLPIHPTALVPDVDKLPIHPTALVPDVDKLPHAVNLFDLPRPFS
jgi:hypothetical protein